MTQLALELRLDLAEGKRRRDRGMRSAAEHAGNEWLDGALRMLRLYVLAIPDGQEFTSEDFRLWYLREGGAAPAHFNAWGSVMRIGAATGIVNPTGTFRLAHRPEAHARALRSYRGARRR